MHSHHSHSGSYISHAVDGLDDVVAKAYDMGFVQFCLTEHMPRFNDAFLYPEEEDKGYTSTSLKPIFDDYTVHARKVQKEYVDKGMQVLVGFEVEGVDTEHIQYALKIKSQYDMIVGSVHHVFGVPIDFDEAAWKKAREMTRSKTSRELYLAYFELQYEVISTLKPHVIGHIDLIRLLQPKDEADTETGKLVTDIDLENDWPEVWDQLTKNIQMAAKYGALFELNSAAIRKGWDTPYPKLDVGTAIRDNGGRFCFSDDSHGLKQIGLNYHKVLKYVKDVLELKEVFYLALEGGETIVKSVDVEEIERSSFWEQYMS